MGRLPDGASPYGILDMIGYPVEWVYDWYDREYYINSPDYDPQGPEDGPIIEHFMGITNENIGN